MDSQLRNRLYDSYAAHYQRLNQRVDAPPPRAQAAFDIMYGPWLAPLPAGSWVLDVGCGTGMLLRQLQGYANIQPAGVDISTSQIEIARANLPEAELTCGNALGYLQTRPQKFSGVFCMDVLEHLPTGDDCLEFTEAVRTALRPGGFCIIKTPNAANLTAMHTRYLDLTHERAFTRTSLQQLMEVAGFINIRVIPFVAAHWSGRIRLWLESGLHRAVYRICGRGSETIFTLDVVLVGQAPP